MRADKVLVEAVSDLLVRAIEYTIDHEGSFTCVSRDGKKRHQKSLGYRRLNGHEGPVAHAIVHAVNQYRREVDRMVMKQLGDEYEEWERLSDALRILQDMVL